MNLETELATFNSSLFLKEFTFSRLKFTRVDNQEVELCDGAVWLDDLLILFQSKQRNTAHDSQSPELESKWFKRKVEKEAVGQFADTVNYINTQSALPFANHRGQTIDFAGVNPRSIHLVALYESSDSLADSVIMCKGRVSSRVGFVHYFHISDYRALCEVLHTPGEIDEYLSFRCAFVQRVPEANLVSEKALFGKFISDTDQDETIGEEYELDADMLVDDRDEFNLSGLLTNYIDTVEGESGVEYRLILQELAKLKRNTMFQFRKRLEWAMRVSVEDVQQKPSSFAVPEQGCAFVFIPLPKEFSSRRMHDLEHYTELGKYMLRASKCVGLVVEPTTDKDSFRIAWLLLSSPWKEDRRLELRAKEGWLRAHKGALLGKYRSREPE